MLSRAALEDSFSPCMDRYMMDAMGRRRGYCIHHRCEPMELPMRTLNDLSRFHIALEPAGTLIAVIEMSLSN
jgi:hypothetical protein